MWTPGIADAGLTRHRAGNRSPGDLRVPRRAGKEKQNQRRNNKFHRAPLQL